MIEFMPFPKLARLNRECVITEKIDGTNAAIVVTDSGDVYAQSRNRIITPEHDNFGFARWVKDNEEYLKDTLGIGHHFGEWWGAGIQRGYGLSHKVFSLFNVHRWGNLFDSHGNELRVVPILEVGNFTTGLVESALNRLRDEGSYASIGFKRPEGIVIYHTAAKTMFKVTLEKDELPKSLVK